MDWDAYIGDVDGFPRGQWDRVWADIDESLALWDEAGAHWLRLVRERMGGDYAIYESEVFRVLTDRGERYGVLLLAFMNRVLRAIQGMLPGIAYEAEEGDVGKFPVLVFSRREDYYQYVSYYYPEEGHFAGSGGMFLHGFPHFAFPDIDLATSEPTAAHELTHACVSHLPLPLWLDEGLATSVEDRLTGSRGLEFDEARQRAYWRENGIQGFWTGESFGATDGGQEHSYSLAQYCVQTLSADFPRFARFANDANWNDGGEAAAQKHYGTSLGKLIEQFFGPGDWSPDPASWPGN